MLETNLGFSDSLKFTVEQAAAQAFVFFIAGFDTSSTTMQFALYEMSLNNEIQKKAREEIESVISRHGGQLTYEALQQMEYLDMVVAGERLKMHPIDVLLSKIVATLN